MPAREEERGAHGRLLREVAAALSRCTTPAQAVSAFLLALHDTGARAWFIERTSADPETGFSWLPAPDPEPFPSATASQPGSACAAALVSDHPIEGHDAVETPRRPEASYLRRRGGAWWFARAGGELSAHVLVLSHPAESFWRDHGADLSASLGLLRPHLALAAAVQGAERLLHQRTSDLELFYEVSRSLARARTMDDIAGVLGQQLGREIDVDLLGLVSFEPDRHQMILEVVGLVSFAALRSFGRETVRAANEQRPDARRTRFHINRPGRLVKGAAETPGGAITHIPLTIHGRPIGLLSAHTSSRTIDESRLRLLYTLAGQAALTLDRVRAVEQAGLQKLRAVLDSMTEGVLLVDRALCVTLANPAGRKLAGEILGAELPDRLKRLGTVAIAPLVERMVTAGCPSERFEINLPDQGRIFVARAQPAYGLRGVFEGAVLTIEDVTEQRRLQEQLVQSEKLSSLGVMISGFAHELNNPLASIIGFAQLLESRDLEGDVRRKVTSIGAEASRCQRIVENLLRFARKQKPELRAVDLNSVVGSVVQLLGYQLQADNIAVDVDLDPRMVSLRGDFHALQQVFVNIIQNAHHALREKGGHGVLRINTTCDGLTCGAEIVDSGPGIAPEHLHKIFDPFFSTKAVGKGTGLGLSIAYGIVKEHGGGIFARSRVGHGTTFVIDLPASEASAAIDAALSADTQEARDPQIGRRILVVDDERPLAELICEALAAEGHEVVTASDGVRAKEILSEGTFDLIISDLKMPNMGGRELYDEVARVNPELARKIIFSTGDSVSADTQAFFLEIGNPYLTKPFNLRDLYRVVHQTLRET